MKNLVFIFSLLLLTYSCGKEKTADNSAENSYDNFDLYTVKTIKGTDSNTKKNIELEVYESVKGKKFLNQTKEYINTDIDSSNSRFYNLEFKKNKAHNYEGNINVIYEKKKIKEIEFKVVTSTHTEKNKILSFKSSDSNTINFKFLNTDSSHPIKGVLCINIETDLLIEGEKEAGYYIEYMLIDSEKTTDNLFIEKYKKKK